MSSELTAPVAETHLGEPQPQKLLDEGEQLAREQLT